MTKNTNNPNQYFKNQLNSHSKTLQEVKSKSRTISIIRILVFIITVVGIYICVANGYEIAAMLFPLGFILFIYLVKIHASLEKKRKWYESLIKINKKELQILDGDTADLDNGKEFLNPLHPYNQDLDIFGSRSLFQLINRSSTTNGRKKLAHRLNNLITDPEILKSRQDAIAELRNNPNWRQNFEATGFLFNEELADQQNLLSWATARDVKFDTLFYRIMLVVNPLIGFGIVIAIFFGLLTFANFLLFLILPLVLVGSKMGVLSKIHMLVSKKSELLIKYAKLFSLITQHEFTSPLLKNIKHQIDTTTSAHKAINKLSKITKSMDYRLNMLVGITLNIFLLWDIRQAIKIERWKNENAKYMNDWFSQLSQIDELQSCAGFAFSFNKSIFPMFKINDFEINVVLAMTGAPVLADSFSIKPVRVFTGIKTTDSLQDGESYFFAELKRLKELIDKLQNNEKLFVILDEVLRGTNSADKQKGSMALISQLINLNASGMIATHDLALGKLIDEFPKNIINKRFEVEIHKNELVFDYKLKEGISQNLNATFLMKKMGITMGEE